MTFLAALPFGQGLAVVSSVAAGLIVIGGANALSPKVEIKDQLIAGRFRLPLNVLGATTPLDRDQLRLLIGPEANPAARLVLRGDLREAVKVEIADADDPTPYIVISTRDAQALSSAISANRS